MKKFLTLLFAALLVGPAFAADAANDVVLSQRKADNSGFIQRNVVPVTNGFLTFDASKVPTSPDLTYSTPTLTVPAGFGITGAGSLTFTAGGSNQSIATTSSGTGFLTNSVPSATVGYSFRSLRNSQQFSIYHGAGGLSLVNDSAGALGLAANASVNNDQITLSSNGAVSLDARGTNQSVSINPSGTGDVVVTTSDNTYVLTQSTVNTKAAAFRFANTQATFVDWENGIEGSASGTVAAGNVYWYNNSGATGYKMILSPTALALTSGMTAGLQLYNTADQTTNYERLEALWTSNVAALGTRTGTTATGRGLSIFAQGTNNAASFSRVDITQSAFPLISFGNYTTQTGTTEFNRTSAGALVELGNFLSSATSGTTSVVNITPTYNQASGTAANTDLLINRTQTAVGSGAQLLADFQVGGSSMFLVTSGGNVRSLLNYISGSASVSGGARFTAVGNQSTAAWGVNGLVFRQEAATFTDTSTAGSGTAASAVFTSFAQPTLAATNSSVTTTDAATVYIAAAPANGTNNTITNPYALWVDAGNVRLDGALITTPQALSGAGAVNVTTSATFLTSTGVLDALTLANGTAEGQIKTIVHKVDGGSAILTPTTPLGFATVTFTNVGETLTLQWTSAGWVILSVRGAVVA